MYELRRSTDHTILVLSTDTLLNVQQSTFPIFQRKCRVVSELFSSIFQYQEGKFGLESD